MLCTGLTAHRRAAEGDLLGIERALLFLSLALLAEVAGTVGGFGSSVFFVPIANFFFDFESVLGITALFHLASNLSKLGLFRAGIDRRLLVRLGVPSVLFAILGGLAGALSGGMAGLVGTGGAVRGLALAAFDLPKEVFVATSAAIDMGIDLSRAVVYWRNGYIHADDLAWIPLLAVVALLGTWLGRRVLRRVPQASFRRIALLLVFAIGWVTLLGVALG